MRLWGDDLPARPPPHLVALVRWHYRRWRARRTAHRAYLEYREDYTAEALGRWVRASDHARRYEWNRPT